MTSKQHITVFVAALLATFFVVRVFLSLFPFSNVDLGPYNIHHLFPGAFLLVMVMIFMQAGMSNRFVTALSGAASALVLDEIVYLIATDGSDLAYLAPVSFWGAVVFVFIALITAGIAWRVKKL